MKKYTFGFDVKGLVLFLLIMVPNFIWFAVPAPHDILRQESITPFMDGIASVAQVMMLAAICLLVRKDVPGNTRPSRWLWICAGAILLYFLCWGAYYLGATGGIIILSLSVFPCIAFLMYEIDRKNWIALFPTVVFTVLHILYSLLNFIFV